MVRSYWNAYLLQEVLNWYLSADASSKFEQILWAKILFRKESFATRGSVLHLSLQVYSWDLLTAVCKIDENCGYWKRQHIWKDCVGIYWSYHCRSQHLPPFCPSGQHLHPLDNTSLSPTSPPPGTRSQHLPPPGPGHNTSLPPLDNTSLSPPGTRSQHLPPPSPGDYVQAGSMHPTGMHSCSRFYDFWIEFRWIHLISWIQLIFESYLSAGLLSYDTC